MIFLINISIIVVRLNMKGFAEVLKNLARQV